MTLTVERWYPLACGLAAGFGVGLLFATPPKDALLSTLTGHGINVAAIAVGFLATALSILVSIERARVTQVLREAAYYPIVLGYLVAPIRLWFGVALSSAALLVAWDHLASTYHRPVFAAWIFLVTWAATATYRVASILAKILQRPT
ncbi:MAG TPA: hypothetical protein VJX71_17745 [Methylomirabilota bacterium]|nr:hypothetical protein [Methylomirabilota bacterium]